MKRSANIEMLFTQAPFEERFGLAKAAGFDAVEFAGWLGKDCRRIRSASEAADMPIVAFTGDELYSPIDPAQQAQYIELVKRSVETAKHLGATLLVTHSNALDANGQILNAYPELTDTQKLLTMYATYQKLAPIMEEAGIVLLVEAISRTEHPGVFMDHVDLAAEIVTAIDSPCVRLLCDIYHMQANGGRLLDSLRKYRDIIGHIHFADVPGRHEPNTGEINFGALMGCIEEIGYQGLVGFALHPLHDSAQATKTIMNWRE